MERTVKDNEKLGVRKLDRERYDNVDTYPKRLLFVDDDLSILDGYKFIFESEGFKVDLATDLETLTGLINEIIYDIIILDYHLKGEKGMDLVNRIYQVNSRQKIMFISGQKNAEEELKSQNVSIAGVFLKPLKAEELLDFIFEKLCDTN